MTTRMAMVIGLAAAGAACGKTRAEGPPPRPVRVEAVQGAAAASGLRYSAVIQAYEEVPLAFKVGGYVHEVQQRTGTDGRPRHLQQGDAVARGSVLARIDPADYEQKVNQARAQLAEAEAGLARAQADAGRAEALYQSEALTRPDYDAATAGLTAAQARVDAARAQLESSEIARRDASLVAPADGVILSRNVTVGTLAGAGTLGFTVADLTRVKAVFGVPDHLIPRVQLGTRLPVTSDAFPGREFDGQVSAVSPSADAQSRVFSVEVTIPNSDRQLKAGMIATVEVAAPGAVEIAPGTPTVSVAAVVKADRPGWFAVFVADGAGEDAVARRRDVRLGRVSGNRVAVESGLRAGERVIVSGAGLVADGDRVRVIPGQGE